MEKEPRRRESQNPPGGSSEQEPSIILVPLPSLCLPSQVFKAPIMKTGWLRRAWAAPPILSVTGHGRQEASAGLMEGLKVGLEPRGGWRGAERIRSQEPTRID